MLIELPSDATPEILVHPRWPYRHVFVSVAAYEALKEAQSRLNQFDIALVLTRGLENEGPLLRLSHKIGRWFGAVVFCLLFPSRRAEARDIFGSNGHDVSADCVDVGISVAGRRIELLARGAFTSASSIEAAYRAHRESIDRVRGALRASGFCIHSNPTEAMQIHCELGNAVGDWRHRA